MPNAYAWLTTLHKDIIRVIGGNTRERVIITLQY